MSALAGSLPAVGAQEIEAIAQDLFATMIDGEHGALVPGYGSMPPMDEPRFTWVDVHGATSTRVLVAVGRDTGDDITRALLAMAPGEPVVDLDFVDAVGELVNVIGGNVKSLVEGGGSLSLPRVASSAPEGAGAPLITEVWFTWRGSPLSVTLWNLPESGESDARP